MSRFYQIYIHTSRVTGKSYIGLTGKTVGKRWKEHTRLAKAGSRYHFHRAIAKYGIDSWDCKILRNWVTSKELACKLEKLYISRYDTYKNGYNSTEGGEGSTGVDPLCYIRQDEDAYNKHLKNLVDRQYKRYNSKDYTFFNPELNIKITCKAMELARKYELHSGYVRYVAQGKSQHCNGWFLWKGENTVYEKDPTYKFEHKDYGIVSGTLKDIAKKYNLSKGNLCMVAKGERNTTGGWTVPGNQKVLGKKAAHNARRIEKVKLATGKVVKEYSSILECAELNNLGESMIRDRCNGRCKSNNIDGYAYRFKDTSIGVQR